MLLCDLRREAEMLSIPVFWWLDRLTFLQLVIVTLLYGVLTVFFDVAYQSYLPVVVPKDQLMDGNSKLGTTQSTAQMLGQAIAGGAVALLGPVWAVLTDACGFVVSALSLLGIHTRETRVATPAAGEQRPSQWHEMLAGLRFVLGHRTLRKLVACSATSNFAVSMIFAVSMVYLARTLGLSPLWVGLILAFGGFGGVAGGLVAARLSARFGSARIVWLARLWFGWTGLLMPLAHHGPSAVLFGIGQFGIVAITIIYNAAQVTYRQAICPAALMGRMNAAVRWISWAPLPLGALAGGAIATWFGVRATLTIGALGIWLAALWIYFSPLRGQRDIDDAVPVEPGPADDSEVQGVHR